MERAGIAARQADVVAALTLEVLKGTSAAFDSGKSLCACSYSVIHDLGIIFRLHAASGSLIFLYFILLRFTIILPCCAVWGFCPLWQRSQLTFLPLVTSLLSLIKRLVEGCNI